MSLLPWFYQRLTAAAAPLVRHYLARRLRHGKEDPERIGERLGIASAPRPRGPLLWIHAASVGEARSVQAVIGRILTARPSIELLLTTGTVASARLFAGRHMPRTRHQYVPVDVPSAVERFLGHWRPDLAIWVESELWPNLVLRTAARDVPMLLVNGRLSAGALMRWRALPGLARPMLHSFALCLGQDYVQAARFRQLGAGNVECVGDLKAAASPLEADWPALAEMRRQIGDRAVWLAASTHEGEEEAIAAAHVRIMQRHRGVLTIIAPRHPARGPAIVEMLRRRRLQVSRRSAGEAVADSDVYVADTMGELGLFFRLADIAFIGGSLIRKGGHNPLEAAQLGCVVLHGRNVANCAAIAAALDAAGAALPIDDADSLAGAVSRLFTDPVERETRATAGLRVAAAGDGVLDAVLTQLAPWLDALAPAAPNPSAPTRRAGVPAAIGAVAETDARA
jgi:3-deoxy-D-manno-octulosonic-acid transferase